jgi:hypothetical protein
MGLERDKDRLHFVYVGKRICKSKNCRREAEQRSEWN